MSETFLSVGKRFAFERTRLGHNQETTAELAGVNRKTIGRIENDETPPAGDLLEVLARHGYDVQFVLTNVRSLNYMEAAEGSADYNNKKTQGVGALSQRAVKVAEEFDQIGTEQDRAHVQAVINAFASKVHLKKKTGDD